MITPSELRAHIETDLSDVELQDVIDGEAAWLSDYAPIGTVTEELRFSVAPSRIYLKRLAASVTQIREGSDAFGYEILDSSEYRLSADGCVEKDGRFAKAVEITYVVDSEDALRDSVLIDLCKLRMDYQGGVSVSAGDYSTVGASQQIDKERARVVRRLKMRRWA